MISEAIDFRFLLLENYKKLQIREDELAVIFMIDHLIGQGNPFINADLLSLKMTLDHRSIDNVLANLLTRGFIEYVSQGNKTVTSLNPLKEKLFREFQMASTFEQESKASQKVNDMLTNIYGEYERLLERPLSQVEFSKIREWISYGYSDQLIIDALKEALSKGKKSLKSVDKILLSWAEREDIEKEGHTSLNDNWDKNLEETIRIAKTPWLDDFDDENKR